MRVDQLSLRNFRNIEYARFVPDPKISFLVGANGQGKTSILEAFSFLATLRSFRGAKNDEVIRQGETTAEINCRLVDTSELKVVFVKTENGKVAKAAFINGKPYRSSTQYLNQRFGQFELGFHAIAFNPADHDLVRGEPAGRRHYLDRVLSAEDVDYLKTLQRYQRTLEQRNALLKSPYSPSPDVLRGFSEPLWRDGARITLRRLEWLEKVQKPLLETARQIAPEQRETRVFYASNWVPEIPGLSINNKTLNSGHFTGQAPLPSLEILEHSFCAQLSLLEAAELRAQSTLAGPHRDDWAFYLGDQPLKGIGSQGEVRSALLALKLSEIGLFRERTGHRPILLLDDFSSELDRDRRSFLLRYLTETDYQVVITTTEDAGARLGKVFLVSSGRLEGDQAEMNIERTAD